eukprot:7273733-Pyramimonas_sp.AAC.1
MNLYKRRIATRACGLLAFAGGCLVEICLVARSHAVGECFHMCVCVCVCVLRAPGDRGVGREEGAGAVGHVGEGEQGLWLHLLHAAAGHHGQAGAPRGVHRVGRAGGKGGVRHGVEAVAHRAQRRAALPPRALAHPLAPHVQARSHLHPGR